MSTLSKWRTVSLAGNRTYGSATGRVDGKLCSTSKAERVACLFTYLLTAPSQGVRRDSGTVKQKGKGLGGGFTPHAWLED